MTPQPDTLLLPADAAVEVGLSVAGLRRLAPVYESLHGPLKRDPRLGRMWTMEACERLKAARDFVQNGKATSIEQALQALAGGRTPDELPVRPSKEHVELLQRLEGLIALPAQLEMLRAENAELRLKVDQLALPVPTPSLEDVREAVRTELHDALHERAGHERDELRDVIRQEVRAALQPERLAVVVHATPKAPRPGLLARLLRILGAR